MQAHNGHVLLAGLLLGFHQTSGTVYANNQTASHFGVQSSGVTGFFNSENLLDPGDDFVGRRVGGLIQVDHAVLQVFGDRTVLGSGRNRNRCVMRSSNIQLVIIF